MRNAVSSTNTNGISDVAGRELLMAESFYACVHIIL